MLEEFSGLSALSATHRLRLSTLTVGVSAHPIEITDLISIDHLAWGAVSAPEPPDSCKFECVFRF